MNKLQRKLNKITRKWVKDASPIYIEYGCKMSFYQQRKFIRNQFKRYSKVDRFKKVKGGFIYEKENI